MDLLNKTNKTLSMNFIHVRRFNRGNFYLSSHSFYILRFIREKNLGTNAKFQHNIFKITPARPKKTGTCVTWGVNVTIVSKYKGHKKMFWNHIKCKNTGC